MDTEATATADAKLKLFEAAFATQNWSKALDAANDVLISDGDHAQALVCRSRVYMVLGDSASAIADAEKAMRCDESNPNTYVQLGHLLMTQGKVEAALAVAEEGAATDVYHPGVLHLRSLLKFITNDFVQATEDASHVLTAAGVTNTMLASAASIFGASVAALRQREDHDALEKLSLAYPEDGRPSAAPIKVRHIVPSEWAQKMMTDAQAFFERGTHEDAEKAALIWASCRDIFRVVGDAANATLVSNKLIVVYNLLGREDLAAQASASVSHLRQIASGATEILLRATELAEQGDTAEALLAFHEAEEGFKKELDFGAAARTQLEASRVCAANGLCSDALTRLQACVKLAQDVNQPFIVLQALNLRAECHLKLREVADARSAVAAALDLHAVVHESLAVPSAGDAVKMQFTQQVAKTHELVGEACVLSGKVGDALEWFERSRSFSHIDALGEQLGREGAADMIISEMFDAIAAADVDVLFSVHRVGGTSRVHLFLLIGDSSEVQHCETSWDARLDVPMHQHAAAALKRALASSNNGTGDADLGRSSMQRTQRAGQAAGSSGGQAAADSADPMASTRTSQSRAKFEAAQASNLRMRAAVADAEDHRRQRANANVDRVPDDQKSPLHLLARLLIEPFRATLQQLAQRLEYTPRAAVSCSPFFFGVPWGALVDAKTGLAIQEELMRPLVITPYIAQLRRQLNEWRTCNGTKIERAGSRANIRVGALIDDTIPTSRGNFEACKQACARQFGVTFTKPTIAGTTRLRKAFVPTNTSTISESTVVHVALRWVQRQPLKKLRAVIGRSDDAASRPEARPLENVDGLWATSAVWSVDEKDEGISHDGWLYSLAAGSPAVSAEAAVTEMTSQLAITVRQLAESSLHPGAVVVLDLEAGWEDGSIATPTLARAFLAAGASAVVAPVWSVPGTARRLFLEGFYAALTQTETGSVTIAFDAAVERLRTQPTTSANVAHWGSFRLFM